MTTLRNQIACRALRTLPESGDGMAKADLRRALLQALACEIERGLEATTKFVDAEFLKKKNGVWSLLPQGREWRARADKHIVAKARRCRDRNRRRKRKEMNNPR